MSEETIVEEEGISVTKAFDSEGFPVPAVTFRVESDRSDPVGIRIVDEIPDGFGIEQIGFHPDYGSEHWTATGEGVVRFERTVEAGEAFTTVYGVRMSDTDDHAPFLAGPTLEVDPDALVESDIDEVVPRESSEIVRELAGGKRETVPGLEETEEAEPLAATAEAEGADATAGGSGIEESEPAGANDGVGQPTEAVSSEDAEILNEGTGDADEFADESDDFGDDVGVGDPVQSEPDDTMASESGVDDPIRSEPDESFEEDGTEPVDAEPEPADDLEEPLDEAAVDDEEPVDEAFEDEEPAYADSAVEEEYADLDEEMADEPVSDPGVTLPEGALAETLAAEIRDGTVADADLAVIREAVTDSSPSDEVRVEHLQARVSDLEAYTDALESFLDENGEAQALLSGLESDIATVDDDVDQLRSRVESAQGEREALRERINTLTEDVEKIDDVTDRLDRIAGDLEAIDERVTDAEDAKMAVESVRDDLDDVQSDVEEFKEWRGQLSNLFG